MTRSSGGGEGIELSRKRLKFRSWHRGTKEMDLLLGPFADARLDGYDAARLAEFERLLDLPEPTVAGWIMGLEPVPETAKTAVLAAIIEFHALRHAR